MSANERETPGTNDSDRPNVVVVLCDQMRRQAMGCTGDPNVETPNLDAMAADGVRFENACSTYPICVPTRFTFMTGEAAHSRYVPGIDWRMSPAERTLADEFSDAGYHTAYTGKWHLSGVHRYNHSDEDVDKGVLQNRTPIPRELQGGFDRFRGFELRNGPFDTVYFENDDPTPREVEGYQTDGLVDLAVEELRDCERPFFQVVSVEPPHPPFVAPEADERRLAEREMELRPNVPGADDGLLDDLRSYYAMVENLDRNVGRLLEALDEEDLREDTVVVFLSDHGEMLGSHGRRAKQHPHEESVGIPFLVAGPGVEAGRAVTEPTCTEDWFPTLCGLAGIDPENDVPGADLTPLLSGERDALARPGVPLEFVAEDRPGVPYADEPWRGFRTERYKYTVKGGPSGAEPWQLFDLAEDPHEQENLVDDPDHEAVARELHGHLREHLAASTDTYRLAPAFGHDGVGIVEEA